MWTVSTKGLELKLIFLLEKKFQGMYTEKFGQF